MKLDEEDTYLKVRKSLAEMGSELLMESLRMSSLNQGILPSIPQNSEEASYGRTKAALEIWTTE